MHAVAESAGGSTGLGRAALGTRPQRARTLLAEAGAVVPRAAPAGVMDDTLEALAVAVDFAATPLARFKAGEEREVLGASAATVGTAPSEVRRGVFEAEPCVSNSGVVVVVVALCRRAASVKHHALLAGAPPHQSPL